MSFISNVLWTVLFSASPFFELRGGIPFGIAVGLNPALVFILGVLANIIVVFAIFFFLDYIHKHLLPIGFYKKSFNYFLEKTRRKAEKHIRGKKWEYYALFVFVALPIPGTGAYAGTLISWFFNLDRRNSILAIGLGVVASGLLVTLVTMGIVSLF
ncbi:MAG: small multi-drug export protein [Candidatus Woesearchaeota archaeon]|nr:MAG: small multi-drug export protein [Candidatus Woesearchaeota archaeon]